GGRRRARAARWKLGRRGRSGSWPQCSFALAVKNARSVRAAGGAAQGLIAKWAVSADSVVIGALVATHHHLIPAMLVYTGCAGAVPRLLAPRIYAQSYGEDVHSLQHVRKRIG